MPGSRRPGLRPGVEWLDARIVPSTARAELATTASIAAAREFTQADLIGFAAAYTSSRGQLRYNPAYDFNGNGFIGQDDARPILRGLASITRKLPLSVQLSLEPGDQVRGHHPQISGGVTRKAEVTVIGRTTPNSIVFTDLPSSPGFIGGQYTFRGQALPVDSRGYFSYTIKLENRLTTTQYLTFDPFVNQTIRSFPILRIIG